MSMIKDENVAQVVTATSHDGFSSLHCKHLKRCC